MFPSGPSLISPGKPESPFGPKGFKKEDKLYNKTQKQGVHDDLNQPECNDLGLYGNGDFSKPFQFILIGGVTLSDATNNRS